MSFEPVFRGETDPDERASADVRGLVLGSRYEVSVLRGRWFQEAAFGPLRNAAWLVRNSRHGQQHNPRALEQVRRECVRLVAAGIELSDVIEALCELLVHP